MDASTASADSSTGHEPDKTLVSDSATPLPDHGREIASDNVQTFNESQTMQSQSAGSAAPPVGIAVTSVICYISSTAVISGPEMATGLNSTKMPMSSSNVIQRPPVNSQQIVVAGPILTYTCPHMQAERSGVTSNENSTVSSAVGFRSICHTGIATQPPRINNNHQSSPVSVSLGSHIMKAEPPTTLIQPSPQSTLIPSAPWIPTTYAFGPGGIRAPTPQMLAPGLPQTSTGQPGVTNVQVPAGMVIVRYDGRLLMIPQQTLAQIQSQGGMVPRPATPANMAPGQAPGNPIISRQITPSTIIHHGCPATTTIHRPPILQSTVWAPAPAMTPRTISQAAMTAVSSVTLSKDTMENVNKCKNFLSTLIKLVSSGKESAEKAANVKVLVKDLLEEKVEPEEFTSRLYTQLNSTPQPYLVPFLKRSLPALRQLTPDSAAFIQQSQFPQPASSQVFSTPTYSTLGLGIPGPHLTGPGNRHQLQSVLSKPGQTASMVLQPQQQRAMLRPPVPLPTTPMVTLRNQAPGHIMVRQHVHPKGLQPAHLRPQCPPFSGQVCTANLRTAQKNMLKEAGGPFKDDDDINDVASMAGVNLIEESDNILATTYGLVGSMTRSCKDEAFLSCSILQRRIVEIGKKNGVTDLGAEVVNYVSHATQQRLQNLLEKVSQVAQQRNINFKQEDGSYDQSSDVRAQLKYFEHLEQIEKQRKEEEEREILLKAAKSRARQEDPEQLRLKQKAKEMQQQELAQMRYREANQTALAAIGPRKKRKVLDNLSCAATEGTLPGPSSSRPTRQRITRVNLRDLLFVLENDKFASRSHLLYEGFLK